jgi:hypothetical protein
MPLVVRSHPELAVLSRLMLALVLAGSSAGTSAAMSECQSRCEKNYKYCSTSGKMSQTACKVEYEKCRKQCVKKDGKPAPA